ncbi:hypothetical protein ABZ250_14165 [Streptomyces afghaniensis]|uniref:hypothetical protein n=1 Tax=Streptomyces afghaniensis TaxID=66865 RepID=UPI0033BB0EE6
MSTSRHSRKTRTAGAALALTAVFTLGGIALAAPASAQVVGHATVEASGPVTSSNPYKTAWDLTWGKAWNKCRADYGSRVKSLNLLSFDTNGRGTWTGQWECRDTP